METEKKSAAPPYVPFRTLMNFLERFKQGVPGRIDVKFIGNSMSGGMRSQLLTSMKALGLLNDNGVPSDEMKKLCAAEGETRQKIIQGLVTKSYPYLFSNGFDFATTTTSLLREALEENTGATGETVSRCIAFLKDAAQAAGIQVSPFLTEQKPRATGRPKKSGAERKTEKPATRKSDERPSTENPPGTSIPAQSSLLLWGLFQRLPEPGMPWGRQERDQWTQTLNNVLILEYPEP